MSWLYGALKIADSGRDTVNSVGQVAVWGASMDYLEQYNEDIRLATSLLVAEETEEYSFKYMLPGGSMAQQRGGQSRTHHVKGVGEWKVELPLFDFGDSIGGDEVALAYMTIPAYQAHVDTIR